MPGALIVMAEIDKSDFAWLDALRRLHYPADRNRVPAHLTLFRTLPPSAEDEVRRSLARAASASAPDAEIAGVMDLDSGVALRISSPALGAIRDDLAEEFRGLLTPQDLGRWTPHVTIQNKVEARVARALLRELRSDFEPRPLAVAGLQLNRYLDGQWEPLGSWRFR
ncbi:MAG TPA: 2'-5' RNA ligase family protein [Sphingomicrobium sp.]|nr:2'-5' RNA ligase family protein [Sphingomicrobium sp.]